MSRITLGIFILFLLPAFSFAQTEAQADSIENRLKEDLPDTTRLEALNLIARYWVDIDPAKSISYANAELKLAISIKNEKEQAYALLNIGNANYTQADYKTALNSYIRALRIHEKNGNKSGIAACSGSIGNVYLELKRPNESIKYFERALVMFMELGRKRSTAAALLSIGTVYSDTKNSKKALDYYTRSLKLFREIGDKESESTNLNNMAQLYTELKEYDKAADLVVQALAIDQESSNIYGAALTLNNTGDLHHCMKKDKKAIEYYNRALEKGKSIGANDRVRASYKGLANAYKELGDYKEAFAIQQLYILVNDTIFNTENSRQLAEMTARFNTEKKEKEIAILTKDKKIQNLEFFNTQSELRKQRIISYIVFAGLALTAVLAFFAFRSNRQKKRANRQLEEKNALIEEKNKEITDSIHYAEKIQRAILPAESDFSRIIPQSFILFRPKDIVSGDFYWIAELDEKIFYATVDCTGHGVPGGFMSMLGTSLLNEIIIEKRITDPGEVLDMLRIKIILALKQSGATGESKDGMDMIFCCIDKKKNTLQYAAANNPLWIVREGKLSEYPADKQPVGVSVARTVQFSQHTIALQKGDTIYTFTDGYADQFGGEKGKKFKYKELEKLVLSSASQPMGEQKVILEKTIDAWKGKLDQVDDILIIGIRV
ncbi:MAG: tetratricopeptide repeat protein [Bacteroidia bacterium]